MTNEKAINWLTNIMADIGKSEHRELWHYEQALTEIRDMLNVHDRNVGEWLRYGEDGYPNVEDTFFWQCDQCLNTFQGRREKPWGFCPVCGARMEN